MKKWQKQMKSDWDSLAQDNAAYYIFTAPEFADAQGFDAGRFFESGRRDVDSILAALHVHPNKAWSVLDIGCGLGRLTRRLHESFGRATGVDVSAEMIARARTLSPDIDFQEVSGTDLQNLADESFDLVFSFVVFQHLPRGSFVLDYLTEIARVLKPQGVALIQANTSYFPALKRAYWNARRSKQADPNRDRVSVRGSCLTVGKIERHAFSHGLMTDMVLYQGTAWTYFRFSKRTAESLLQGQRHAEDTRPELLDLLQGKTGADRSSH
jgi:SAM-dependent methyltransferase